MMPRETFALIAGTGVHEVIRSNSQQLKRLGPAPTPFGLSAPLYRVRTSDAHFLLMPRHGDPGGEVAAPWVNYRANIYALKENGVQQIMAWSGASAINVALSVGLCVLPHDLIDDTSGRESSFFKGTALGRLRQHPVFCDETRQAAESAFRMLGADFWPQGIYACTQGPRLATPAEVRRLRSSGADLLGMTLAPEAFLARELEICYLPVCCVTGYAEGIKERDKSAPGFEDVLAEAEHAALAESLGRMLTIASWLWRSLPYERKCICATAMQQCREQARVEEDWHTWIGRL